MWLSGCPLMSLWYILHERCGFLNTLRGPNVPLSQVTHQILLLNIIYVTLENEKNILHRWTIHSFKTHMFFVTPDSTDSNAVGRDSWILLSLNNFLENILQPTNSKISLTLTSGLYPLFLVVRLSINIVERSSKSFKNSFLKNGIWEFWPKVLILSILTYSSDNNSVHNQKIIF